MTLANTFSPRVEEIPPDRVLVDLTGVQRLFGDPRQTGEAIRQQAAAERLAVSVAVANTYTAAHLMATTREGLTVIEPGQERAAVAALPVQALDVLFASHAEEPLTPIVTRWGVRTLGALAALPTADLRARLGTRAIEWQRAARGEDTRPLRPSQPEERFEATVDLEWPIDTLEPLSFVLTGLLEPLCVRLEQRDRGVAAMHLAARLTTRETIWRHLELPAPMRDVRTLRTLLLLHLDAHPPEAAIDHLTLVVDPTPARILQHTLFTRAYPAPEQVATLLARLVATMGADRIGTPVALDTDRPGAFDMQPFRTTWDDRTPPGADTGAAAGVLTAAFRRYRPPVPVRVAVDASGAPTYVTVDRTGVEGGRVRTCAGPWITSGAWWLPDGWDCEEWDVCLVSGIVYRLARQRDARGWFIHAIAD